MSVTGLRDWARLGGGGINSAGNALLYKVTNSVLSEEMHDLTLVTHIPRFASTVPNSHPIYPFTTYQLRTQRMLLL